MGESQAASREALATSLLSFLALECPPLLPAARDELARADLSLEALEERLLRALERMTLLPESEEGAPLYPGVGASEAAGWFRESAGESVRGFFARRRIRAGITAEDKKQLYWWMVLTRALDARLKELFVAGDVRWKDYASPMKGFRSLGQEAVVGAALRLRRGGEAGDVVAPLIRDLGVALAFNGDVDQALLVQAGKAGTPMEGRDLHIGDLDHGVLPPAAPLAVATQTLVGMAYAFKLDGSDRVCVSFIGEGGSSLGEWHEAVNFAAVRRLNMVFVLENNQWALGTHVKEQSAVRRFASKAAGYGIPGVTIFGNDPEEVAAAVAWAADRARAGKGPALIELATYRGAGHAHHDDDRYRGTRQREGYEVEEEREIWGEADPIDLYRRRLASEGALEDADEVEREAQRQVDEATARMRAAPWPEPQVAETVFAERGDAPAPPRERGKKSASYDEAIGLALAELMEEDGNVFVVGEDVGGRYGGAFGVTRGLAKRFGDGRCLNAPLAESAIVGCAVGAALGGKRPVAEIQFADFASTAFNALVNNAAKIFWRYGEPVPMVVRLPYGAAAKGMKELLGGGPFHSQCPEAWFARAAGWKIVAPAFPEDAKGLLAAAVRDPNPVLYLESKGLYSFFSPDLREEVPLGADFEVPIGVAKIRRDGRDLTCITWGAMVFAALEAAETLSEEGVEMEVIDLRTLVPLDEKAILSSVARTNRALIVHEDSRRGGFGAEIAAILAEKAFSDLEAPVARVAAPDTPVPYSPPLEYAFLPKAGDIVAAALDLVTP